MPSPLTLDKISEHFFKGKLDHQLSPKHKQHLEKHAKLVAEKMLASRAGAR
jgi:hypothetical protein